MHHSGGGAANTADRPGEARLGLNKRCSRDTTAGSTTKAGASKGGGSDGLGTRIIRRRRAFDGHRDDLFAAEEDKAKCAALLTLFGEVLLGDGREAAELLAVTNDEVHVAIEGHELPDELAAILDGDPHTVVDVLEHLRSLGDRHGGEI